MDLQHTNIQLRRENAYIHRNIALLSSRCRTAAERNKSLTKDFASVRSDNRYYRKRNADLEGRIASLEADYNNLREKNADLCDRADHHVSELEQRLQEKDARIQRLGEVVESKALEVRDLSAQLVSKETAEDCDEYGQLHMLQEEVLRYKNIVAASNQLGPEIADTSIQQDMNGLFYTVREWALKTARHQKQTFSPSPEQKQWLAQHIPGYVEKLDHKVQALMIIFFHHLVICFERRLVFGTATLGYMADAASLYCSIQEIPGVTRQKKKQWTALTNELLSKKGDGAKTQAVTNLCFPLVSLVKGEVESAYGLGAGSSIGARLWTAIQPYMRTLHQLHHQEADYCMQFLSVSEHLNFRSEYMEDVDGEDGSLVHTSLFPLIYKTTGSEEDPEPNLTIVCKAKVLTSPG